MTGRLSSMRTPAIFVIVVLAACAGSGNTSPMSQVSVGADHVTIFTHCGFYEFEHDGTIWTPESIERGSSPEGTGFNATDGIVSRVGEKLAFQADSGLTVTFAAAPPDLPPVPGCD